KTPSDHCLCWQADSWRSPSGFERLVQHDGLHAVRSGGDHVDGYITHFSNTLEVAARIDGQFVVFSDPGSGFRPARQLLEHRLGVHYGVCTVGQNFEEFATVAVTDTDLQSFQAVQDIELGDAQAVDAVNHHRALHGGAVEPTTSTRPAGNRAEFFAHRC